MTERITQSQLDFKIERLVEATGIKITKYNCYGYFQLGESMEAGGIDIIKSTYGNSKKDLYYQIDFALDILQRMRAKEFMQ